MDLSRVMQIINEARVASANSGAGLEAASREQKAAILDGSVAKQEELAGQRTIAMQQERGMLQAQKDSRTAATSLGTNMSDASEIITSLGSSLRDSAIQASKQADVVATLDANNNLFTNPAGFAFDLLFGNSERGKLDSLNKAVDAKSRAMGSINAATQQTAATQQAIAETRSDATVIAQSNILNAQANQVAAAAAERLAGVDMQLISSLNSLNSQQTSLAVQGYNLQVQAEQMAWARENQRLAREERDANRKVDESLLGFYNAGAAKFNMPQVDNVAGLKMQLQLNKGRADFLIQRGNELVTPGVGQMRYGNDPINSLGNIQQYGIQLPKGQEQVAKKIHLGAAGALNAENIMLMYEMRGEKINRIKAEELLKDKAQRPDLQRQFIQFKASQDADLIDPANQSSIYALPSIDILEGAANLRNNRFLAQSVAPIIASKSGASFDPSGFLSVAKDGILKGEYSASEAAEGISWMAQQLMLTNNSVNNYQGFGLPPMSRVPMAVSVDPGGLFQTLATNADMADPSAVQRVLTEIIGRVPRANLPGADSNIDFIARSLGFNPANFSGQQRTPPGVNIVPYGTPGSNRQLP